jgi:hypothetical protein
VVVTPTATPTATVTASPSPTVKPPIKIKICHKRKTTIEVGSLRALIAHLLHGDRLGPCKKRHKHKGRKDWCENDD